MKAIRNISFVVLLALVLLTRTVGLGATPEDWCPANCWCLGEGTTFFQIDCSAYDECTNQAYIRCGAYCNSIGSEMAFDYFLYGSCLNTCTCNIIP